MMDAPLLVEYLAMPPSASIAEKYRAPLRPQGRLARLTSNVNSLFNGYEASIGLG